MNGKDREDFVLMKSDIRQTKKDTEKIKIVIDSVSKTVTKISQKLFKDDDTGEEGYFQVAMNNRVRLTKLENIKVAVIFVFLAIGGSIGWIANNILGK